MLPQREQWQYNRNLTDSRKSFKKLTPYMSKVLSIYKPHFWNHALKTYYLFSRSEFSSVVSRSVVCVKTRGKTHFSKSHLTCRLSNRQTKPHISIPRWKKMFLPKKNFPAQNDVEKPTYMFFTDFLHMFTFLKLSGSQRKIFFVKSDFFS